MSYKKGIELIMQMDKQYGIEDEYWRIIKDFPNYSVSTFGNVRNDKTGRILKPGKVGKVQEDYYAVNLFENGNQKSKKIHKLVANAFIVNPKNKRCVDHIDRNKLNNNINNLRFATDSENQFNKSKLKRNTSGYVGVSFDKQKRKWKSYCSINGKLKHLGLFETAEEANVTRQEAIKIHYGEYANL